MKNSTLQSINVLRPASYVLHLTSCVLRYFLLALFFLLISYNEVWAKDLIAYSHLTNGYWQIWVMDPDGKNQRQVTFTPQDKRDPAWILNGPKLSFRTSNSHMYTIDLDGKNETEILQKYGVVTNPNFSKVNNEIVFIRFDPRGKDIGDIWRSDINGENSQLLTRDKLGKFQPCYSPDGNTIAFVKADSDRKNYHLWLMNSDGSDPRKITEGKGFDTHPDFSPDEKQITFSSNARDNNFDIYAIELVSKKITRLTQLPGLDTQSNFSPDGEKIVFVSDRSGNQQIWMMDKDGSNAVKITNGAEESIDPAWGKL